MQDLLHNQLVITSVIGAIIAIVGVFLTRKKLAGLGLKASQFLNSKIGSKATQWIESKLQEFLDGMKSDNGAIK